MDSLHFDSFYFSVDTLRRRESNSEAVDARDEIESLLCRPSRWPPIVACFLDCDSTVGGNQWITDNTMIARSLVAEHERGTFAREIRTCYRPVGAEWVANDDEVFRYSTMSP